MGGSPELGADASRLLALSDDLIGTTTLLPRRRHTYVKIEAGIQGGAMAIARGFWLKLLRQLNDKIL